MRRVGSPLSISSLPIFPSYRPFPLDLLTKGLNDRHACPSAMLPVKVSLPHASTLHHRVHPPPPIRIPARSFAIFTPLLLPDWRSLAPPASPCSSAKPMPTIGGDPASFSAPPSPAPPHPSPSSAPPTKSPTMRKTSSYHGSAGAAGSSLSVGGPSSTPGVAPLRRSRRESNSPHHSITPPQTTAATPSPALPPSARPPVRSCQAAPHATLHA